ncbi:MAG: NAD(P)/FAD-dependent oxidoreductase, partial [Deltaproteobacteria bacterium]|nr:NAD(P)/FAD-dependent oxidoreductase [Deltaproteobacteria bacterium]
MERVPEEKDMFDITIIGAGPTGLFGAFYAGMRGLKTKVIDALPDLGGQLTALYPEKYIYDTPGHPKVLSKDLVKLLHEQTLLFPPTFCLDEEIVGLEKLEDGTFLLQSKEAVHRSKVVIICAGIGAFSPNRHAAPGVAELEGKRVHYKVKEKDLFRGKRLLVIGGGDSAVDWA